MVVIGTIDVIAGVFFLLQMLKMELLRMYCAARVPIHALIRANRVAPRDVCHCRRRCRVVLYFQL